MPFHFVLAAIFACGVASFVVTLPNVAVLIMMLTLGFGFPLLFAPAPIPYLLVALPFTLGTTHVAARGALAAVALVVACVAPNLLARRELARMNEEQPAPRLEFHAPPPRTIEILGSDKFCDELCFSLLQTGQVDWLRLPAISPGLFYIYAVGDGRKCEFGSRPRHFCVTALPDSGAPAALRMEMQVERMPEPAGIVRHLVGDLRRIRVFAAMRDGNQTIYDQSAVEGTTVGIPALLTAKIDGMQSEGVEVFRNSGIDDRRRLVEALKDIGYALP